MSDVRITVTDVTAAADRHEGYTGNALAVWMRAEFEGAAQTLSVVLDDPQWTFPRSVRPTAWNAELDEWAVTHVYAWDDDEPRRITLPAADEGRLYGHASTHAAYSPLLRSRLADDIRDARDSVSDCGRWVC